MPKQCSNYTQVVVIINDVNDNAPEFAQQSVAISIPEDFKVNKTFFTVFAKDKDRNEVKIRFLIFKKIYTSQKINI